MASEKIFWDAWAFIALVDNGYRYQPEALIVNQQLIEQNAFMVTTEAVLTEVANIFAKVARRQLAKRQIELAHQIVLKGSGQILAVEHEIWQAGWQLYEQRPDKDWGHTDCMSFVVMRELKIMKAFTADVHFEQAGFERLVKI